MKKEKNKLDTSKNEKKQLKPKVKPLLPDKDLKSETCFGKNTTNNEDVLSFEENIDAKGGEINAKKTKGKSKPKKWKQ